MLSNLHLLKSKLIFISFVVLSLLFGSLYVKSAFADAYTLSGKVSDSSGNNLTGATITVTDASTNLGIGETTADNLGNYSLTVNGGTYNIRVTPPEGSNFSPTIVLHKTISSNTTLNFVLTPAGTVTLNGHLYDANGRPVPNHRVFIDGNGVQPTVITDQTGAYSFQATPGTYKLGIYNNDPGNSAGYDLPSRFFLEKNISLTQSTVLDITVPAKRVNVHVQDSSGNSISNVVLNTSKPTQENLSIGGGITDARGDSSYETNDRKTDSNGNITLWVFPSNSSTYTLTAKPPSGSNFPQTNLSNVNVTGNTTETIVLPAPVTLSGRIYDANGRSVPNHRVFLEGNGVEPMTITDGNGYYSLQVTPGTYRLGIYNNDPGNSAGYDLPSRFFIQKLNLSLTQNRTLDITVPGKKVSIHVQDSAGNPVSNVVLNTTKPTQENLIISEGITANGDSSYETTDRKTDANGNIILWLFPSTSSTYTLTAIPPNGSNFPPVNLPNVNVSDAGDTTKTITLQQPPVTLNGHIYDASGRPAPNQKVYIVGNGVEPIVITDASGSFTFQATPGNYRLGIYNNDPANTAGYNLPSTYNITKENLSLTQNTTLEITIPVKKVTIHIQNPSGDPISNVALNTTNPTQQNLAIGSGITDAYGYSNYDTLDRKTNSAGNLDLWLLPSNSSTYNLTAIPPNNSQYSQLTMNNITVTEEQTQIVSLQYNHAAPITTANLVSQHADGTYSNPTTVTLSAAAASGYSVANTFYKIDGGSQQTYSSPFTVSGEGSHTITYWSVDNSGVPEAPKTKTFTIFVNQAPHVNPISDGDITAGGTYTENGSFTDADSASWTATVDYGDGAGEQNLPLSPDKTFSLSHQYNTAGTYTVTVVVRDTQQGTGTTMATVTVTNPVLSGTLRDSLGNPVANQKVQLFGSTSEPSTITNSSGNFSISANPGTYTLSVYNVSTDIALNIPYTYVLSSSNLALTQNRNLDITIPTKKVTVHVQDQSGNPVTNTVITTGDRVGVSGLNIGSGITNGTGYSEYHHSTQPKTDASGNATLWLYPNTSSNPYTLIATPPSGGAFNEFAKTNVVITGEQTETITLQYNHAAPVTTATLETQNTTEDYSNPTTVTLSATAASGYTVANTYYTVDGGAQQTYASPFTVSGEGNHTITYWSVDTSGVPEAPKTKTFTIHVNQAPHVNPIDNADINQGATYSAEGSFTDADSTSWTATVDYGDGTGEETLPLNADKTFSLSHQYDEAGTYTVTVVVRDNEQATGTTMGTVNVNGPPQIAALTGGAINVDRIYTENGSFTDADSSLWVASVDYGDGSGEHPLDLTGTNFALSHTYTSAGQFTITVKVADNKGAYDIETTTVTVINLPPQLHPLTSVAIPEGESYAVSGSFTDDSTSWTATIDYGDGSGVQSLSLNTDKTFALNHLYKDNGTYTVTVVITDNEGISDTGEAMVTVNNLAPEVGTITASINPVEINTPITASASFTDAGVLDSHTAVWNWGDGTTSTGTITNGTVSDQHAYTATGVYEISLTVTDNNGGTTTKLFQYLSVFNPNAGWASGSKEFISPAGAVTGNAAATGKADFGFQVKFFNGDLVPSGKNFVFSFPQGNIEFESTVYQWLVVDGEKATFKADGTLNGLPGYTLLVSVIDQPTPDKGLIRVQIKDSANNVIYDTQPGAVDTADPTTSVSKGKLDVH